MELRRKRRNEFAEFVKLVRLVCEKLYPGIGRYDRVVYGRINRVNRNVGTATAASKLWSVDVELLNPDLSSDTVRGVVKDVPIDPIEITGDGRAMFPVISIGLVVRLGWMYGRRDLPYIVSFTSEGQSLPYQKDGELTTLIAEALELLSSLRESAVGPVPMDPEKFVRLRQIIMTLPGGGAL